MHKLFAIFLTVVIFILAGVVIAGMGGRDVIVKDLRCEYRVNPFGIDIVKPRLSWTIESSKRNQVQTAYQVLVAGSEDLLHSQQDVFWDSGKVESAQSNQVVYKGKPLKSRIRYYWKVRVWDKQGKVTAWSEPAFWTMGLLNSKDWQAEWVGYDAPMPLSYEKNAEPDPLSLEKCKWVWFPEDQPQISASVGTYYFRHSIKIDENQKIKQARFGLVVDNEGALFVNGQEAQKFSGWKSTSTFEITDKLKAGINTLAIAATNRGDAPNPAALAGQLCIEFETGEPEFILIDSSWKTSDIKQENWQGPDLDDSTWSNAREIAKIGDQPWGKIGDSKLILPPPPYLRKVFSCEKPIKRAVVYASALGLYELHINDKRVGEDYFTPGWTDYPTRLYYQTYDVTNLIHIGSNVIGAILADGWYAGYIGFGKKREHYGDKPRLFVQLEAEYSDGTRQMIVTDKSWKACYGPHLEADFLMGETYDARKEMSGWDAPGFDDSNWYKVDITDNVDGRIQAYPGVTVKKMMEIKPIRCTEPKKGQYVYDLGQNFTGWVRLKVSGEAGIKVVLRFAEMLNPDGTIYTENLREARCTDTYILKGIGTETWQPRFTYHGFRYVEVTGYPDKPGLDAVTGIVVHSDTPVVGSFECSSPMINQLYSNITWSQRSNFIEVPTDCPQRDERLGWTGDAQIFIRTATYNMDVAAFFTKWLVDLEDGQTEQGAFPDVAPRKVAMGSGVPAWGDAGIICPWTIYEVYGDKRVLEKHYESMKRWISYLEKNSKDLLRPAYGYGDWVSIGSDTPKDVIATAYFAYSTRLLSKMAAVLGKNKDARQYETLFGQIRDAFNKAYVSEDAHIKGDTQTGYCLGLYFDLIYENKRELAAKNLVEAIRKKNWHLSTGFVGLSYLLPTLTESGHLDIAYRLLNNESFPSWGYSIKNGATTIWERWDGWTEDKGFHDPGMNSFNHYSFGSVGRWLFEYVAGIDTEGPGYKQIIIRPRPGGGLTYAKASYKSIYGRIVSDWKIEDRVFTLNVTIPANTNATVYIPAKDADSITEGGKAVREAEGVRFLRMEDGSVVFAIGSGQYEFVVKMP